MAVDGHLGTGWSPNGVGRSWIQVDLGRSAMLTQIEFVTRQDYDQPETRRNVQVWASNNADMSLGRDVLGTQGATSLPFQATYRVGVTPPNGPSAPPATYRYVRLVKTVAEKFFVSELRVYARDVNLAAHKRAWATSNSSSAPNATDTNDGSTWVAAGPSSATWVAVDLGAPYQLHQIRIVTRQDLDRPETRRNFEVRASNNSDMSSYVSLGSQGATALPFQGAFTVGVSNVNAYRYLAVAKTSSTETFAVAEIRIYGKDSDAAPGKNTGAQSQWSADFAPPKAVDQSILSGWTPAYGATSVFWQIDLGRPYTLGQIALTTRQDIDQPLTRQGLALWASNNSDMSLGHSVVGVIGAVGLPFRGTWLLDMTDPTAYQYVALVKQNPNDGAVFIAEFAARAH